MDVKSVKAYFRTCTAAASSLKYFSHIKVASPAYLIFFVTSQCFGRCKHCFYWDQLNKEESPLTLEEIDRTAASMKRLLQVTLTGGEPFLRNDVAEIAEIFYRRNKVYHLAIATSGFHALKIEKEVVRILDNCPSMNLTVGLSVDGPESIHDDIRGVPGIYKKAGETLARLKFIQQKRPNLTIMVNITASAFNKGKLLQTYDIINQDFKPDYINVILTRGKPRIKDGNKIDVNELRQINKRLAEDAEYGRLKGYRSFGKLLHAKDILLRQKALEIYQSGQFYLPCTAGRISGVLMPEGEVYPCELRHHLIGQVRKNGFDFKKIWLSDNAERERKEIRSSRCVCYHQCFLSNNIFFNLKAWPEIIKTLSSIS